MESIGFLFPPIGQVQETVTRSREWIFVGLNLRTKIAHLISTIIKWRLSNVLLFSIKVYVPWDYPFILHEQYKFELSKMCEEGVNCFNS